MSRVGFEPTIVYFLAGEDALPPELLRLLVRTPDSILPILERIHSNSSSTHTKNIYYIYTHMDKIYYGLKCINFLEYPWYNDIVRNLPRK